MSKNLNANFPDAITKRDILHGHKKIGEAEKKRMGTEFSNAEWYSDAIDFLTAEPAELEKVRAAAVAEGNVFLLLKLARATGQDNDADLATAAQKAEALGKVRYAIRAYEKLGDTAKVSALKATIAEDGDMKTALNSVFIPKSEDERADEGDED